MLVNTKLLDLARQGLSDPVHGLSTGVERVAAGPTIEIGDTTAWFHAEGSHAVVAEGQSRDMVRTGKRLSCRRGIPHAHSERNIPCDAVMNQRCVRARCIRNVNDRRQHFVIHRHQLCRVARLRLCIRDDDRDAFTHISYTIQSQRPDFRADRLGTTDVLDHELRLKASHTGGSPARTGENCADARGLLGGSYIDGKDPAVGVRRVHKDRLCLTREINVSDKLSLPT